MRKLFTFMAVALMALGSLTLVSCGGDDDDNSSSNSSTTTDSYLCTFTSGLTVSKGAPDDMATAKDVLEACLVVVREHTKNLASIDTGGSTSLCTVKTNNWQAFTTALTAIPDSEFDAAIKKLTHSDYISKVVFGLNYDGQSLMSYQYTNNTQPAQQ